MPRSSSAGTEPRNSLPPFVRHCSRLSSQRAGAAAGSALVRGGGRAAEIRARSTLARKPSLSGADECRKRAVSLSKRQWGWQICPASCGTCEMPPMTLRAVVAPRGPCPASHPVASTSGASTVAGLSRRHAGKSLGASRCPPRGVRGHGGALPGALERPCRAMPRRADSGGKEEPLRALGRRELGLMGLVGAPLFTAVLPADAVQGYTPGRIPGLSNLDDDGFRRYTRPEGKQGGHGVGWSEIPRYTFRVPDGYDETAVSIADLGGAEIDMRMRGPYGALMVVVAPVMRFLDVGFNADIRVEELGSPGKLLSGFAPELFGRPLEEGQVKDTRVFKGEDGLTYYWYEVSTATVPHSFVSITALKNRVFILATSSNAREFRKGREEVRSVQESFRADVTAIPGLAA